jgi:alginate O-acetyltransferase complex protein AlgI
MGSTSFEFLGFALAAVAAFRLSSSPVWRRSVFLIANLVFLGSFVGGPWSLVPLAAFLGFGYAGVALIRRAPARSFLPILAATIAAFVWLKKYAFVPGAWFLPVAYVTVGLSYILFRLLHLMIDTRSGNLPARVGVVSYLNYTLNFTTLVSGPIQPYQEFEKMSGAAAPPLNIFTTAAAVERIVIGLFKANVAALLLSTYHTRAIAALASPEPAVWRVAHAAMIVVYYPFFLYCNVSGYIDIVIGIGRLLGLTLPENFNRPFAADNFITFWNCWHMALSNWLKTYVYNPLLMSLMRRFPARGLETTWLAVALFVTFFLVGVWHGQTSEFLFFGFLQGFSVSTNRMWQIAMAKRLGNKRFKALSARPWYVATARGFTFTWFSFTLLWFWSNWGQLRSFQAALSVGQECALWLAMFAAATALLAGWESLRRRMAGFHWDGAPVTQSQYWRVAQGAAAVTIVLLLTLLMNQRAPEIVYKAF